MTQFLAAAMMAFMMGTTTPAEAGPVVRTQTVVVSNPWSPSYRPSHRAGYVWQAGHWRGDRYIAGYWMPTSHRAGYVWVRGHWRGQTWVAGHWRVASRAGHTWVAGYYTPTGGWVGGHWRATTRAGYLWTAGYWNGRVYVPGRWTTRPHRPSATRRVVRTAPRPVTRPTTRSTGGRSTSARPSGPVR